MVRQIHCIFLYIHNIHIYTLYVLVLNSCKDVGASERARRKKYLWRHCRQTWKINKKGIFCTWINNANNGVFLDCKLMFNNHRLIDKEFFNVKTNVCLCVLESHEAFSCFTHSFDLCFSSIRNDQCYYNSPNSIQ